MALVRAAHGNVTPSLLERRAAVRRSWGTLATVFDVLRRVHAATLRAPRREPNSCACGPRRKIPALDADDDDEDEDDEDGDDRRVRSFRAHGEDGPAEVAVSVPITVPELVTAEKRRLLRGVELVFSGVVPSGVDWQKRAPAVAAGGGVRRSRARAGRRGGDACGDEPANLAPGDGQDDLGDAIWGSTS